MRPETAKNILRGVVGAVLVVAFAALDYAIRPHLTQYVGDNDIYLLIIILVVEFVIIWRAVVSVSYRPLPATR